MSTFLVVGIAAGANFVVAFVWVMELAAGKIICRIYIFVPASFFYTKNIQQTLFSTEKQYFEPFVKYLCTYIFYYNQ